MKSFLEKMEGPPQVKIASLKIAPGMTPEQLDDFTRDFNVIVLTVYATGTSPEILNEVIKKRTTEGKPVFLVSDNPGDRAGIIKVTYGTQEESKNSGAIALEKVNVNDLELLDAVIKDEFAKGKRGAELGEAVRERFAFQDDEPKPIPDWDNPDELAKQESIYRKTLQRSMMGLNEQELDETIRKWRGY